MRLKNSIKLSVPEDVIMIINKLNNNGFEAWLVGGCLRNMLLGFNAEDWDIATNATPEQVSKLFVKTIPTGIKHGTVTVIEKNSSYEITTFRKEGPYLDFRRPSCVQFISSVENDLARRDFTINALAWHPVRGIKDLFGGIEDINTKTIRCVGNPHKRFCEDALRMLRAVRFRAQLGFTIENETKKAICKQAELISKISAERITVELNKILMSEHPQYFLELNSLNLLPHIMPGLINKGFLYKKQIKFELSNVPKILFLRWAALLISSNFTDIVNLRAELSSLKMDKKTLKRILSIVQHYPKLKNIKNEYCLRKFLSTVGYKIFSDIVCIKIALEGYSEEIYYILSKYDKILLNRDCISLKQLAVSGNNIIKYNLGHGKKIGIILDILLECVLEKPMLNEKDTLVMIAEELKRYY